MDFIYAKSIKSYFIRKKDKVRLKPAKLQTPLIMYGVAMLLKKFVLGSILLPVYVKQKKSSY